MNQKKIGKFIAVRRREAGMTQQALSERLGVSDKTVGNWENGRNLPDPSLYKPLCDELGITLAVIRLPFFFTDLCGKSPAAWYNGFVGKRLI